MITHWEFLSINTLIKYEYKPLGRAFAPREEHKAGEALDDDPYSSCSSSSYRALESHDNLGLDISYLGRKFDALIIEEDGTEYDDDREEDADDDDDDEGDDGLTLFVFLVARLVNTVPKRLDFLGFFPIGEFEEL